MYIKFLPKVRGGAQRAEGAVVLRALLYDWQLLFLLSFWGHQFNTSVLNQNKDARAVRPYLTSVFHHSWQLYSVQGVALRYVDYALTGRFHSARQLYSVLCSLFSVLCTLFFHFRPLC